MINNNNAEILLVEDSIDDAEMTIRALKKILANSIVHLEDGQEALDYLFGKGKYIGRNLSMNPKVILLDIKMPRVDGIEVLRQIKTNTATQMLPVVIMTSSSAEQDMINSYSLGVNSYVVKPMNFENFAKAINDLGLYWLLTNRTPTKASL